MWQTIIKSDNKVYINNVSKDVDCSALPENFHALQWNAELNLGWIEWKNNDGTMINENIDNILNYQIYFEKWKNPAPTPPIEPLSPYENQSTAKQKLSETDWVNQPDVYDPLINPHLLNRDEFLIYRSAVRQYIVYPIAGDITWPVKPTAKWS